MLDDAAERCPFRRERLVIAGVASEDLEAALELSPLTSFESERNTESAMYGTCSRACRFVPPGRVRFVVGTLQATGLDDGELDAAVCLDAIFFAPDRIAALREVRRVLRPGGRFLFTADEQARPELPHHVPDWTPLVETVELDIEAKEIVPWFASRSKRLYALWLEHLDQIRTMHGDHTAAMMEQEAS
jgi:ubiquinone/menaquinone biosynthesis C-methylase UbiE